MADTSFSGVSLTGARRSLGAASPFVATAPGGFSTFATAVSQVMASPVIARTLPQTTRLKKRVRFILEPVYRLVCSRQAAFPADRAHVFGFPFKPRHQRYPRLGGSCLIDLTERK